MPVYEDIKEIKGIGEKTAKLFNKLSVYTVEDLLKFYPRTYIKYSEPVLVKEAQIGINSAFWLKLVSDFQSKKVRNLNIGTVYCSDGQTKVKLTYFNTPYYKDKLKKGSEFVFYGKISQIGNEFALEQPVFYTRDEYENLKGSLQPVYSLTKGLSNKIVTKSVKAAIEEGNYPYLYEEYLPEDYVRKLDLISKTEAYIGIHFPDCNQKYLQARKRLAFDELFVFLWILKQSKGNNEKKKTSYPMIEVAQAKQLIEKLPYKLTDGQNLALSEIINDLCSGFEMNRLVQGDVGSGKTIIAFISLVMCVFNGYQGALMAPTEILATQHYENLCNLLKNNNLNIEVALLTGSVSSSAKKKIYEELEEGKIKIVIGTHAILQDKVKFEKLALVITDEQHRFGVKQRLCLSDKGGNPHILVMSATPIPRTLAIVLYGDLSLSVIKDKPAKRLPVKNCVVGTNYRKKAYEFIEKQISEGRQVYIVCPMVEESEGLENVVNVTDYSLELKKVFGSGINIEMLHGKMKNEIKNNIMENFANHNIDILVATSVIEVGIDVPNATVMMIENAERFGLSSLHQLRGRIGRGEYQSYAIFINGSRNNSDNERLNILNSSNDGFRIAEEDLRIRGAGDIFGIRQSGQIEFEIADIYEDSEMIIQISQFIDEIMKNTELLSDDEICKLNGYIEENKHKFIDFRSI